MQNPSTAPTSNAFWCRSTIVLNTTSRHHCDSSLRQDPAGCSPVARRQPNQSPGVLYNIHIITLLRPANARLRRLHRSPDSKCPPTNAHNRADDAVRRNRRATSAPSMVGIAGTVYRHPSSYAHLRPAGPNQVGSDGIYSTTAFARS